MSVGSEISSFILRRLEAIQPVSAFTESVERQDSLLLDLTLDELDKGKDSQGDDLGSYASISYKGRLRPVDLKNTGDFRRSYHLKVQGRIIIIDAYDPKLMKLIYRYGDDIVGLPAQRWTEVKEIVAVGMIDLIKRKLK